MKNWACADHFCLSVSSMSTLLWLHLTPDCLYWDMVRVSVRDPLGLQLKWCQLCPQVFWPPELWKPARRKGQPRYLSCVMGSSDTGSEEEAGIAFMFSDLHSSCWDDGSSEPALGTSCLGAVRISNSLWLNGGLDYVTVVQRLLAAVYHP